jgi:stage II sporulation protein D
MVMPSSPTHDAALVRTLIRRLASSAVAFIVIVTAAVATTIPAAADTAVSVNSGSFTIHGAGWGHGWGMSQYGAYGAARKGLSWKQILAFYYRGTQLKTMPAATKIKVWISADNDSSVRVLPASGLTVRDTTGHRYTVPAGTAYTSWRISRRGTGYRLSYRTRGGSYVTKSTGLSPGTWSFSTRSKIVKVVLPSGSVRSYRGSVALIKRGSGGRTINNVLLEDYVKGVVPAEMPTSWAADAVRAQAVAARSYAVWLRDFGGYSGLDICDTTACQVYGGLTRETHNGNAAVKATASKIVTYRGKVALTQFASSNGGYSAPGDYPYLAAHRDPYDFSDQVSGLDPQDQRQQRQPTLALGGDSEAVADHQSRRRRLLGWSGQDDQDHRNRPDHDCFGHYFSAHVRHAFLALHDRRKHNAQPGAASPTTGRGVQANRGVRDLPASLPIRLRSGPVVDQRCRCAAAIPSGEGSSAAPCGDRCECWSLHPCRQRR